MTHEELEGWGTCCPRRTPVRVIEAEPQDESGATVTVALEAETLSDLSQDEVERRLRAEIRGLVERGRVQPPPHTAPDSPELNENQ